MTDVDALVAALNEHPLSVERPPASSSSVELLRTLKLP